MAWKYVPSSNGGGTWVWWRVEPQESYTPTFPMPEFTGSHGQIVTFENHLENSDEEMKKKKNGPPFLTLKLKDAFPTRFKEVPGEIGLEIEAEGKNLFNSPVSFWKVVSDGSLRPYEGHSPVEYVLREPLPRDEVRPALKYLSSKLKAAGSEVHMSHRCSVHVHVNCLDMTMQQIAQFLCMYFMFEELLVEYSGADRAGNLFCLRAKDADFQIELLMQAYRTFNFGDVFNQNFRYSACNVTALGMHGSLEFRSLRGTVDQKEIEEWVRLLLHLKDLSMMYPNPSFIGNEFMHMGPMAFADKFFSTSDFQPETKHWFMDHKLLHGSMWTGFRTMRDVAFAIDWKNPPPLAGRANRTVNDIGESDDE